MVPVIRGVSVFGLSAGACVCSVSWLRAPGCAVTAWSHETQGESRFYRNGKKCQSLVYPLLRPRNKGQAGQEVPARRCLYHEDSSAPGAEAVFSLKVTWENFFWSRLSSPLPSLLRHCVWEKRPARLCGERLVFKSWFQLAACRHLENLE